MTGKQHSTKLATGIRRGIVVWGILVMMAVQPVFSQAKYIQQYRPLADSLQEVYGIPAGVMLGVAIIESGSGTSRNAKLLNNHFGIVGKNNLLKTKGIKSRYKQYASPAASYVGFCQMLSRKKFYAKLKGNMDYKQWLDAMAKARYSEAPVEWKKRITAAIRKHKLAATP